MCLSSFMAAEYDDLPEGGQHEVRVVADVNIAWLAKMLTASGVNDPDDAGHRPAPSLPPSPARS